MLRLNQNLFLATGALALALGLSLHLWIHGSHVHFASGFLLGMSVALLIHGWRKQPRRTLQR